MVASTKNGCSSGWVCPPADTLFSCIASSNADCVLGVARLISSASTRLAKTGPRWNYQVLAAGVVLARDGRADDVARHQVGRELDARELQVQHVGQRLHQLGLADAGNALQQHVPARQQAGHDAHDVVVVADDDPRHLLAHDAEVVAELLDLAVHRRRVHRLPSRRFMK